jgi:hypothetical protein
MLEQLRRREGRGLHVLLLETGRKRVAGGIRCPDVYVGVDEVHTLRILCIPSWCGRHREPTGDQEQRERMLQHFFHRDEMHNRAVHDSLLTGA